MDEPQQAERVLNSALDAGVTFLDTAECYGNSEELVGSAVSHRRDEYILATKAGHVPRGSSGEPWTGKTVGDGIDNSLRRLKTDCVDLVQVHAYDISAPTPDDVLRALTDARDAGKTRLLGYSGENEDAVWALQSGLFDALQTSFNLVDQCARHLLFELAEANGVGIIAKRPIANAVALAVHLQDVNSVSEAVQQGAGESLRAGLGEWDEAQFVDDEQLEPGQLLL